jgi:uncharacterized protein (DUF1015 family)
VTIRPARLHLVRPEVAAELAEVGYESLTPDNAARLRRLASDGAFVRPAEPTYVVYQLAAGGHRQTGVVVEVALNAYRDGRIRAHEATDPERVRRLGGVLAATRLELVPLTLAHDPCPELRTALAEVSARDPDVRVTTDRVDQAAWVVRDAETAHAIREALSSTSTLYIADGHHRIAAAEHFAGEHAEDGGPDGSGPVDYVLGALFPWDEVRILGYHRAVERPLGRSADDLVAAIVAQAAVAGVEDTGDEAPRPEPGSVAMRLDRRWYRIRLRPASESTDPRESLDLAIFEAAVLGDALDMPDATADPRVEPVPGTVDPTALERRCAEREEIGFLFHPPSTAQVRAVSDAGQVMPRKATWFDPKARTGPFLRDLTVVATSDG